MSAMTYEFFIRNAFNVGRDGDPAGLADADWFKVRTLDKAKAGIIYSMVMYNNRLRNMECDVYDNIEGYIGRIIRSNDLDEIINLINKYTELIRPYNNE
jgi:hypothetical protein